MEMVSSDLEKVKFVTLSGDASNHGNIKMFPVIVRYFSMTKGVQHKMLEFASLSDEKADTIIDILNYVCKKYHLEEKIISYSADNAPVNFGGLTRGGNVNVFHQLQARYGKKLVGVGCNVHLLHNTSQNACNGIDVFNVEAIVVEIYKHFHLNTVRVTHLKEICDATDIEYMQLLGYGKTRFLAFRKCITRIIHLFDALEKFFLDPKEKNVPRKLKQFFKCPIAKLLLIFVRDQSDLFEESLKKMEGDHVAGFDAAQIVCQLKNSIEIRIDDRFCSYELREETKKIKNRLPFKMTLLNEDGDEAVTEIDQGYIDAMIEKFHSEFKFSILKINILYAF